MEYCVRKAQSEDLSEIKRIYAGARRFMAEHGNPDQWGEEYPTEILLRSDMARGNLFVLTDKEKIRGVFYFSVENDPTYSKIYDGAWHSDLQYGVIHRIAGDGSGGILRTAVEYGLRQIPHLRIDTHEDNYVMQKALEKHGFQRCGIIYIEDGSSRIAYDILTI